MMNILFIILLFILGTVFGSFGGVLIGRNRDKQGIKSILFGRSECNFCQKTLTWSELIPIFSFLFQKGKCKNCGKKLSNFYRIIELVCGIVFVLTYLFFPFETVGELVFWLAVNRCFVLLIFYDIQKYELHMPIWIILTLVSIVYALVVFPVKDVVILLLSFVIVYFLIYFLSKIYVLIRYKTKGEGFGMGDVYLSVTMGILSNFVFQTNGIAVDSYNIFQIILLFVILSCIVGIIYACVQNLILKNKDIKIPFLPSMIVGFWILLLFGKYFISIFG